MVQLGYLDEARTELCELPIERLSGLPRSRDYLATIGYLAFVAIETAATAHAKALFDLLEPHAGLCIVTVSLNNHGPVSRTLAGLARSREKSGLALDYYVRAARDSERFGLMPQLAQTQYEWALLVSEGTPAERDFMKELLAQARGTASQLGMMQLVSDCESLLAKPVRSKSSAAVT